jgi:demethylmenaquinone methyltransferase/2-methoxy-6-polyprenyl-1,4-benzoquinol methylase
MSEVKPYKESKAEKKEQVAEMFNNISPKYDLLNRVLSVGIDIIWRKKSVRILKKYNPKTILDVATGTGDFAVEISKIKPEKIVGVDISQGMLDVGIKKIAKKQLDNLISLEVGDAENMKFDDASFDAITVAFGVRNFQNLEKGLQEFHRVLNNKGVAIILEFSQPEKFPVKQFYNFYFTRILPFFGKLISKDSSAYTYLPESVNNFPYGEKFLNILKSCGFSNVKEKRLSFGIATIYVAEK